MHLFLHELVHLLISLAIGFLVWRKYKEPLPAFVAALLGGIYIDADHLFDYYLAFGFNFNLSYFLNSYQFSVSRKIYVPFHAWEWVILLLVLIVILERRYYRHRAKVLKYLLSFFLALTLGIYSHLIIDTVTNDTTLPGYSIIYRVINNFNTDKISNEKLPID